MLVKKLKENGAVIIGKNNLAELANYLSSEMPNGYSEITEEGVQPWAAFSQSFKHDFEEFTQRYGYPITKLEELIGFNKRDPQRRIRYGQDTLEMDVNVKQMDKTMVVETIRKADFIMKDVFKEYALDGIVFLQDTAVDIPTTAGYPELAIPFGMDAEKAPAGVTFVARKGEDEKLLNFGYSFEQKTNGRMKLP